MEKSATFYFFLQVTQAVMYSRQQILQAIITEGHQMLANGSTGDRVEFEKKLDTLDQQWQSLVKRANQKRAVIEANLSYWQTYRTQAEKLEEKMKEMDELLKNFDSSYVSIRKIRALLDCIKVSLESYIVGKCCSFC